jgi:hypothetical protein
MNILRILFGFIKVNRTYFYCVQKSQQGTTELTSGNWTILTPLSNSQADDFEFIRTQIAEKYNYNKKEFVFLAFNGLK